MCKWRGENYIELLIVRYTGLLRARKQGNNQDLHEELRRKKWLARLLFSEQMQ